MSTEQIRKNHEILAHYFARLSSLVSPEVSAASSIFELNSSAYGHYVSKVLQGNQEIVDLSFFTKLKWFFLGSARLWARVLCFWFMKYYFRGKRLLDGDIRQLKAADILFIGHVAPKDGRFVAKDFAGFMDRYTEHNKVAVLGQRLPHIQWCDYLSSPDFIPVEAHMGFKDVFSAWSAHAKLLISLAMHRADNAIVAENLRDFSAGRGPNSTLYACTAAKLVLLATSSPRAYIPLERHDWECLILYFIKQKNRKIPVSLVQNCTFSCNDCNMYVVPNAPVYRRTMPDRCYVIDEYWRDRLAQMGLFTQFEIMPSHRFSDFNESIRFDPSSKKILYLGSINPQKVDRDFKTLAELVGQWEIDIRLHPSLSTVAFPARFKRISEITGAYGWCIHADTSMAVFLRANDDRFIYIDHPDLLNQNPLPVLGRQGRNYTPEQLLSIMGQ